MTSGLELFISGTLAQKAQAVTGFDPSKENTQAD